MLPINVLETIFFFGFFRTVVLLFLYRYLFRSYTVSATVISIFNYSESIRVRTKKMQMRLQPFRLVSHYVRSEKKKVAGAFESRSWAGDVGRVQDLVVYISAHAYKPVVREWGLSTGARRGSPGCTTPGVACVLVRVRSRIVPSVLVPEMQLPAASRPQ